ncbi:hypothetical protein O7623_09765 [Solwaraspora sp. WMMD791]|uniref:hypothetical protein n=1 Tax=Solwaraspora sp. WMMD791 TaxID=3016086 RepID=UPI00249C9357|nr:hypothetical protein [Solwaraspora sp. WMMD791]WFE29448.1 hypothetical protein O7623_09765 [Solwaraspora sp. WMMD791]
MSLVHRRHRRRAAVFLLCVATTVVAVAAPAAAAERQRPSAADAGAAVVEFSFTRAGGVAATDVITCTATADNPHLSTHNPGNINVVGRVNCTATVAGIDLVTGLFRGNTPVASARRVVGAYPGTSVPAPAPCVNGTYYGVADAYVFAPRGYQPPYLHLVHQSAAVSITC